MSTKFRGYFACVNCAQAAVTKNRSAAPLTLMALLILGFPARTASPADSGSSAQNGPRIETTTHGPVEIVLRAEPGRVDPTRDVLLTVEAWSPKGVAVRLPDLTDRLLGFVIRAQSEEEEPQTTGGRTVRRRRYLLSPLPSVLQYRLAPLAITYTDARSPAPQEQWFPTRPIVFEARSLPIANQVEGEPTPVRLPLSWQSVLWRVGLTVGVGAILALGIVLGRRLRRRVRERRLSPGERAIKELARLLARHLIEKNLIKEFYLELTMIVRRYIERQHGIRAPEQTTEEFLFAASHDARFPPNVLDRLRAFLEAADLVKFAAYRPPQDAIDRAVLTARDYIETDAASLPQPSSREGGQREPEG